MLRNDLNEALKSAMKAREETAVSTLRMILAAVKDKDIAARTKGVTNGIPDDEIGATMQNMIRQRRDSMEMYEKGNRPELAAKEAAEIVIIERFLPKQMGADEIEAAVKAIVAETGASSIKDMGKVMGALKQKYTGQMDMSQVGPIVKRLLGV